MQTSGLDVVSDEPRIVLRVFRRPGEEADRLSGQDVRDGDGGVVARFAEVEVFRYVEHAVDDARRGEFFAAGAAEEVGHFVAAPAEGEGLSHAGLRHAVADDDEVVALARGEAAFAHELALDRLFLVFKGDMAAVADEHTGRVVVFREVAAAVFPDAEDHEGGVGDAAHFADGQRMRDGVHGVFDGGAAADHRRYYF